MARTTGMVAVVAVSVLVALAGGRPQAHREVKLITEPRPGQEFVMIQSSVFQPRKHPPAPAPRPAGQEFVTSHKIPGKLPEDDPEDLVVKKLKRESPEAELEVQDLLLTPDQTLALQPSTTDKVEVRTEFSVVTSKPRKGAKAIAFAAKEADSSPAPSPTAQVPEAVVRVETKGETGKLEASLSGDDEKKVMQKKLATAEHVSKVPVKDEPTLKEVEVKVASELGVNSPKVEKEAGAITVPLQKKQVVSPAEEEQDVGEGEGEGEGEAAATPAPPAQLGYEILPVNILPRAPEKPPHRKEKDFDFVDSPLADKLLVPAGSNQQSRIEVKKGPNGQDYEYEYVYYYYDDEDNDAAGGAGAKKTAGAKASPAGATEATTSRHYLPKKESEDAAAPATRSRTRGQPPAEEAPAPAPAPGKTRYTSIDRTTTAAPDTANEVLPTRGAGSRTRGRILTTEEPTDVSDERLPVQTRFPPRSRSNHNSNSVASTTPLPQDAPTRGRGSSGGVRRPSLDLVDSKSFKTQSSDASRDQDPTPEFPKTIPAANEEEVVKPRGRGRGQAATSPAPAPAPDSDEDSEDSEDTSVDSHSRGQLSRRPDGPIRSRGQPLEDEEEAAAPSPVTELPGEETPPTTATDAEVGLTDAAMDKAALELYAVLSQARAESNSVDEDSTGLTTDDDLTTELDDLSTTPEVTTEPTTTTTTTTTTPAPTTTTTTTEAPAPAGRGRYRQRGGSGGRKNYRGNSDSSTTTTTETPTETSTKGRARFGANRASTPRRGSFSRPSPARSEEEPTEREAAKEEAKPEAAHPRPGGFTRNRFGAARTPKVTTPATTAAASEDSHAAPHAHTPAKPVFADRFNLRRRGGLKPPTTAAPASEEPKGDSSAEETNEPPAEASTTAAPSRLPGRGRLSVGSGPRPLRPGPRVNIAPRGRLGTATTTTTAAPSTEPEDTAGEQSSATSQDPEGQQEEGGGQEVVTTPVPDALTRLRNRPRLRVSNVKPTHGSTPAPIRRGGLIPRRKLGGHPAEVKESAEAETQDASSEETPPSHEETSEGGGEEGASPAPAEPEQPQGLASLVAGRRRGNALRRPRTLGAGRLAGKPS